MWILFKSIFLNSCSTLFSKYPSALHWLMFSMLPINTFIKPRECLIYSKEIIEMSHKRKRNSVLKKKKKEKKNPNRAQKDISSKAWRSMRHLTDVSKCPSCLWNALNSYHFHMADIASIKVGASFSRATFEIQLETYFYPQGKKKKKRLWLCIHYVSTFCKSINLLFLKE